jgi:hypothetical protein
MIWQDKSFPNLNTLLQECGDDDPTVKQQQRRRKPNIEQFISLFDEDMKQRKQVKTSTEPLG